MSDDPERSFVDTNVFVYAHDRTAGKKRDQARALLVGLWHSGKGCLSLQVLQELFVAMTRKVPTPLQPARAFRLVSDLSRWNLHAPARDDLLAAIELHTKHRISLWDAMIVQSASRLGCGTLWTEDLGAGQSYAAVTVRNPFA
jgi:predicted nucleic acid-binding protein